MSLRKVAYLYLIAFITLTIAGLHIFLAFDMCKTRKEASIDQALRDYDEYLEELVKGLEPPCEFWENPDGTVVFRHR